MELSLQAHTLREQYPGTHVQAPHQKDAPIERRPRPRQMNDDAIAYTIMGNSGKVIQGCAVGVCRIVARGA